MTNTPLDGFGVLGTMLENKYYISRLIAEGGFGVVYQATHVSLQRPVALKILKVPSDMAEDTRQTYLENFAQEARLIAALEHPAIVRVIDFGVSSFSGGVVAPWTALEWLEGTTLESLFEQRVGGMMHPMQAFGVMEIVIDALAFAHEEGVVHRDVKPSNLMMVVSRRGEQSLKVLDFGIAKLLKATEDGVPSGNVTQTSSRLIAFSPQYAAPEQLTGMRTGPWTDVHALALVLVELLCGRPALTGADVSEIYSAALSPVRPTPATLGIDVGAWEPVLARALAFRPSDRIPNARSLLESLRSSLGDARHRPISVAPPISRTVVSVQHPSTFRGTEVPMPPVERRRSGLLVGATVATFMLVLLAVVVWRQPAMNGLTAVTPSVNPLRGDAFPSSRPTGRALPHGAPAAPEVRYAPARSPSSPSSPRPAQGVALPAAQFHTVPSGQTPDHPRAVPARGTTPSVTTGLRSTNSPSTTEVARRPVTVPARRVRTEAASPRAGSPLLMPPSRPSATVPIE